MSYQVIARKWRPQTFEEVTGQENITQTLRNALEYDRLHHAYLFSGARGVGKTTTARLLAKALNCHKTDKPNLFPCSSSDPTVCPSCLEISESRSLDVFELDAASHTGIDNVRETILDGININPARDRFKVFIIDEVHMLSKSSFNALLKTLEEPPPNVVFIMATTELHKVPETILSRCQEFEFRTIPLQKIFDRLNLIAEAEKIDISPDALREIARSGEGSMRDAQSNFDQVISFSGEKIGVADVTNALGMASVEMLTKVLTAIAEKNPKLALYVVDDLVARGQDLRNFARDLLSLFRDLLVFKIAGTDGNLIETSSLNNDEMQSHAAPFSESDLVRFFNSLCETETKLKDATQSRYIIEIGLIKLVEMRRVVEIEKLLNRIGKLEQALNGGSTEAISEQPQAASFEKKTLIDEPKPEEPVIKQAPASIPDEPSIEQVSASFPEEPPHFSDSFSDEEPRVPEKNVAEPTITAKSYDLSFLDSINLPLPDIDSEELEHVEDTWLDNAFDERLLASGDDLMPIANAPNIAAAAIGGRHDSTASTSVHSNGSGTAVATARETPVYTPPVFDDEPAGELPVLSEDPSEDELLAYANAHPVVRKALRIFRGKIVEVKRH
ncbi:MAG: DNA polymerase III subunit gamma/tau [Pyrinomonadaceae bacterium]